MASARFIYCAWMKTSQLICLNRFNDKLLLIYYQQLLHVIDVDVKQTRGLRVNNCFIIWQLEFVRYYTPFNQWPLFFINKSFKIRYEISWLNLKYNHKQCNSVVNKNIDYTKNLMGYFFLSIKLRHSFYCNKISLN